MNTPPTATSPAASEQQPRRRQDIGVLLFDDVEELDAVGPWEVLANWTLRYPDDGWAVSFISRDGQPVRAAKGSSSELTTRSTTCRPSTCSSIPAAQAPAG